LERIAEDEPGGPSFPMFTEAKPRGDWWDGVAHDHTHKRPVEPAHNPPPERDGAAGPAAIDDLDLEEPAGYFLRSADSIEQLADVGRCVGVVESRVEE